LLKAAPNCDSARYVTVYPDLFRAGALSSSHTVTQLMCGRPACCSCSLGPLWWGRVGCLATGCPARRRGGYAGPGPGPGRKTPSDQCEGDPEAQHGRGLLDRHSRQCLRVRRGQGCPDRTGDGTQLLLLTELTASPTLWLNTQVNSLSVSEWD
jgi:hypothetical protein